MPKSLVRGAALILMTLSACRPATTTDLPTLVAAQPTLSPTPAPTTTPTRRAPVLPPTFTPTHTATATPTQDQVGTPTPPGFRPQGTIFYLYNGDAIVALDPQSGDERVVMQFGMGQRLADLAASPDGALLAFTAPSINASREAHVMNRDGSYVQQISCLRFPELRLPRWTPDGATLVFFAAQTAQGQGNLFRADVAGAGNCPQDNRQGLLVDDPLSRVSGLIYDDTRRLWIVADEQGIAAYGPQSDGRTLLVPRNDFGPQARLGLSASRAALSYIAIVPAVGGFTTEARLLVFAAGLPSEPQEGSTLLKDALDMLWHPRAERALIVGREVLALAEVRGSLRLLDVGRLRDAVAAFSPDGRRIVYSALDESGVIQLYVLALDEPSARPRQLTRHVEGSVDELLWLP
ncbi:MAG: hypothetical protein NZ750_07520 [Anaerolineae bacterium]|nr:hypothetical protein [Anaerolineae bacterium]MDW8172196.1 hypothetical protein [Anaerolineae bacterium]